MHYRKALDYLAHQATAWIVLVVSLVLTSIAWFIADQANRKNVEQRFHFQTENTSSAIAKRLLEYEAILRSGAGLFNASHGIDRAEWHLFVQSLNPQKNFPGIQGLGFSVVIDPENLDQHISAIQREGFANYTVTPPGKRDFYTSVIYLEPFDWRNQRAFGYDMYSDAVRRKAMEQAMDSGLPSVSGRVMLMQETAQDRQAGFLMFMPVYKPGLPTSTVDERRKAILGFVFSPFRATDFMRGILNDDQQHIDLVLFDGETPSPEGLLFTTLHDAGKNDSDFAVTGELTTLLSIPNELRSWRLFLRARPDFLTPFEVWQSTVIAVGGVIVDLFLFLIVLSVSRKKLQLEHDSQQLKEQLQESEERYGALFLSASPPIIVIDPDSGAILDTNPAAQRYYGYDGEQFRQLNITDINPLTPAQITAETRLAKSEGRDFIAMPQRLANGSIRQVEIRSGAFRHSGKVALYAIVQDVTERKQRELELIAERQRLANVISGTASGTWEWNIQTGEVLFNERWAEIIGYTLDELAPLSIDTWTLHSHPEDLVRSSTALEHHFSGAEESYECEVRMRHKDGHWVWILDRGRVISRTPEGQPLMMYGTHIDISARKATEERLYENELLLHSAIETIGEAFVVYDAEDRLAFHNEKYREVYQFSAPVIEIGRSFEEIIRYGAERGQYREAIGRVDEWVAERLAIHQQADTELIQPLADGQWLKIRERKTQTGHTVGFRVDVTELYQAKQAAEAASLAKSRFLATMSHEIRTPMNGVLGMAQVLLVPEISIEERQECARTIIRSGQTLLSLLNDLLDLSKVEAGKLELQSLPISPSDLVHEMGQLFAPAAMFKHLRLTVDSKLGAGQYFLVDPIRLRQMLANLIGNAIKFTPTGEIRVELRQIDPINGQAVLEFAVSDTGIGIHEDKIPSLFEPFSQVDDSATRQFDGSGLGLSIVSEMARLMGGSAGVSSALGSGSRFWFTVATEVAQPSNALLNGADATPPGESKDDPSSGLNGHILVVEDDSIHRLVILTALSKLGLSSRVASNGQEAVDLATSGEAFDLILMDIVMPVFGGYQATEQIREWEKAQGQVSKPIIAITADAFDDARRRCLEVGMQDFLAKPIRFSDLRSLLEKWLPHTKASMAQNIEPVMHTALDSRELLRLINAMMPLLNEHKFDAFGHFKGVRAMVANTHLAVEVDEIGKLLNRMAFDQTIERLTQLTQSLERDLLS